jgi:hypothetical protein
VPTSKSRQRQFVLAVFFSQKPPAVAVQFLFAGVDFLEHVKDAVNIFVDVFVRNHSENPEGTFLFAAFDGEEDGLFHADGGGDFLSGSPGGDGGVDVGNDEVRPVNEVKVEDADLLHSHGQFVELIVLLQFVKLVPGGIAFLDVFDKGFVIGIVNNDPHLGQFALDLFSPGFTGIGVLHSANEIGSGSPQVIHKYFVIKIGEIPGVFNPKNEFCGGRSGQIQAKAGGKNFKFLETGLKPLKFLEGSSCVFFASF